MDGSDEMPVDQDQNVNPNLVESGPRARMFRLRKPSKLNLSLSNPSSVFNASEVTNSSQQSLGCYSQPHETPSPLVSSPEIPGPQESKSSKWLRRFRSKDKLRLKTSPLAYLSKQDDIAACSVKDYFPPTPPIPKTPIRPIPAPRKRSGSSKKGLSPEEEMDLRRALDAQNVKEDAFKNYTFNDSSDGEPHLENRKDMTPSRNKKKKQVPFDDSPQVHSLGYSHEYPSHTMPLEDQNKNANVESGLSSGGGRSRIRSRKKEPIPDSPEPHPGTQVYPIFMGGKAPDSRPDMPTSTDYTPEDEDFSDSKYTTSEYHDFKREGISDPHPGTKVYLAFTGGRNPNIHDSVQGDYGIWTGDTGSSAKSEPTGRDYYERNATSKRPVPGEHQKQNTRQENVRLPLSSPLPLIHPDENGFYSSETPLAYRGRLITPSSYSNLPFETAIVQSVRNEFASPALLKQKRPVDNLRGRLASTSSSRLTTPFDTTIPQDIESFSSSAVQDPHKIRSAHEAPYTRSFTTFSDSAPQVSRRPFASRAYSEPNEEIDFSVPPPKLPTLRGGISDLNLAKTSVAQHPRGNRSQPETEIRTAKSYADLPSGELSLTYANHPGRQLPPLPQAASVKLAGKRQGLATQREETKSTPRDERNQSGSYKIKYSDPNFKPASASFTTPLIHPSAIAEHFGEAEASKSKGGAAKKAKKPKKKGKFFGGLLYSDSEYSDDGGPPSDSEDDGPEALRQVQLDLRARFAEIRKTSFLFADGRQSPPLPPLIDVPPKDETKTEESADKKGKKGKKTEK